MGVAQNALLGATASVGVAASKFATGLSGMINDKKAKKANNTGNANNNNVNLASKLAEISANKGLLDDYTKEYTNFMRTKTMREKRGT